MAGVNELRRVIRVGPGPNCLGAYKTRSQGCRERRPWEAAGGALVRLHSRSTTHGPQPGTGGGFFCGACGRKQPHRRLDFRLLASRPRENSFLSCLVCGTFLQAATGNQYLARATFCQKAQVGFSTLCSRLFSPAQGPRPHCPQHLCWGRAVHISRRQPRG